MRAVRVTRYGGPEVLTLVDEQVPDPGEGELRIEVEAAALNPLDWRRMRADPAMIRLMGGLRHPRNPAIGADMSGTVTAIGDGVTGVALGDRVFGATGRGSFAEQTIVRASDVVPVPTGISSSDAAALPVAGCTALQALRDWGGLREGGSVLVHGASGGVGHLAVQLARSLGGERVDAVASGANLPFVRSLGADAVWDYTREDVTAASARYDVVVDTVLTHPIRRMQALLAPGGTLSIVGMVGMGRVLGPLPLQLRIKRRSRPDARIMAPFAEVRREDLEILAAESDAGRLRAHVEEEYPLERIAEAMARLEAKHVRGKLIVRPNG